MSSGFGAASLAAEHDCLLVDLDGTTYRRSSPITGAIETLDDHARRALERWCLLEHTREPTAISRSAEV